MKRRTILLLWCWIVLAGAATAAERSKPVRIGVLTEGFGPTSEAVGLRDGLKTLGYREDQDFVIGVRFTQGDAGALPAAAKELMQRGVDIVLTDGRSAAKAAQQETTKIPIIFAGGGSPVEFGLIQSFARPGGNVTGVTDLDLELGPKRLEIFKEMIPGVKRVFFGSQATDSYSVAEANSYHEAARRLKITIIEKTVQGQGEAGEAFDKIKKGDVQGLLAPRSMTANIPGFVRDAGVRLSLPTMFASVFFAENGGLASYNPNTYESGRMAARLVDKILKGVSPGDIPVEVNDKIELVINVKVARALGIKIAPEVLSRANKVIR